MGIRPGQRACILNAPDGYEKALGPLPVGFELKRRLGGDHALDFIHFFTPRRKPLEQKISVLAKALDYSGTLWVSWPKGSSGMQTDLNENVVREIGLQHGLVDVKVAAVDEVWSGLKFVYRVENRPKNV
ncbi:MAG: DUF3052 domain-containing protein [Anaerolineales bacterium]